MKKILSFVALFLLCLASDFVMAQIPADMVSVYAIRPEDERAPIVIAGGQSNQLLGPASGWGDLADLDFSAYKKLVFNLTFDAADAGKQVAVRFNVNSAPGAAVVKLAVITLPATGTTYSAEVNIEQYAADGKIGVGGMVFYNGASHWSFTYDIAAATGSTTINYVALSKAAVAGGTGVKNIKVLDLNAKVNVYSITGALMRKDVSISDATDGLKQGIYIVGGKKVVVRK
jgi:hypothetical protein